MYYKKYQKYYNLMLLPGVLLLLVFSYIPMFGIVIAFQKYIPTKGITGSKWIGLDNFKYMFSMSTSWQVFGNTISIAVTKIVIGLLLPIVVALLINEVRNTYFKKSVQTVIYLPYFLSWVILGTIFSTMFSGSGVVNSILGALGIVQEPILFMQSNRWFRSIIIGTDVWKSFGYNTIIYISALAAIDTAQYESAVIDGANRWKLATKISLPSIKTTIILLATLSLGNILNAGFEQILTMYNPIVYEAGDIIDTVVYRMGLLEQQYGIATAMGLMKSLISCVLIIISYISARKFANYTIF